MLNSSNIYYFIKGANINYQSSIGRTPLMVSVVANKTDVIDHLLLNNADTEICDLNGDSALTIAKKFNNKLGQHRLTQFKWKKRADMELKEKKSLNNDDDGLFPDKRLPHQVFDSSKKTWLKGNFMQIYMMHLVPMPEFSGGSLSAPRSIGKEGFFFHKFTHRSKQNILIKISFFLFVKY
jgi:ankyrin repeat protein